MKLVITSDTHTYHKRLNVPDGDIFIHAGDFTSIGRQHEVENFFKWLLALPHKYKIFIAGNHDKCFDPKFNPEPKVDDLSPDSKPSWLTTLLSTLPPNIFYLENTGIEIEGIKFWGAPQTPKFGISWAFNVERGKLGEYWKHIPTETDVLITHGPAQYKVDYVPHKNEFAGDAELRYFIDMIKPKLHISGHLHEGYGVDCASPDTVFINASALNNNIYDVKNKPWVVEITSEKEIIWLETDTKS